jgi:phosphoribosylanthranilate isomerase
MILFNMVRVKICCINSIDEATLAVDAGADAIGLVSAMPSGPSVIDDARIASITATVRPSIATFLLTSRQRVEDIAEQHARCGTNTVQLCDTLLDGRYDELRDAMPGVSIVQVVHVRDAASIDESLAIAEHVDALLLDSGRPSLAIKELGGTGRTHDWALSASICRQVRIPVFLAGGLNCGNIEPAIRTVAPWGVDLCSGVRTNGRLDREKVEAFIERCRNVTAPGTAPA